MENRVTAGEQLRAIREKLGLTIRDVEAASSALAEKHQNPELSVSLSRLSDIETKGVTPSIYKLYALAALYRRDLMELLALYGLNVADLRDDSTASIPRTHISTLEAQRQAIEMPVRLDPGFDPKTTFIVGRMIQAWGILPMSSLAKFQDRKYTYGYIGSDDLTMYPILLPGTFVQIDEKLNKVLDGGWRSEYERPIYMIETRSEYLCSWCEVTGTQLTIKPHPLSPEKTRILKLSSEAEIVGQVVGAAMRLTMRASTSEGR